jgi:CheY-like chemotaxis protein
LNLISNAVKFTRGGYVLVEARAAAGAGETALVRLSVTDSGIGIDEARLPALFEEFTQADGSTTRKYGGTGLGLAISKRLVELMGGEIAARSTPGVGSTFLVDLPIGVAHDGAPRPDAAIGKRFESLRSLLIDERDESRAVVAELLESWGMEVTSVASLEAAGRARAEAEAGGHPYDLALARPLGDGDPRIELATVRLVVYGPRGERSRWRRDGVPFVMLPVAPARLLDAIHAALPGGGGARPHVEELGDAVDTVRVRPADPQPPGDGARVLVAEDNPVNQKVAVRLLERLGYQADVVANGREAVEAVRQVRYDVVLMDCQMPEMDGFEATQAIRQIDAVRDIPILAVTANAFEEDRERCLAAGMNDYIAKPITLETLSAMMAQWVAVRDAPPDAADHPSTAA